MLRTKWTTAAFTIAGLGLLSPAQGDQIADMQAQIDALRTELTQVKSEQGDNWLNERRAEEVKGLIMEVLSDADTRASLLNDGAVAGHDGKRFFIASPDGAFAMYFSGQLNFRYIYNNQDTNTGDEDEGGFQSRAVWLKLDGHIADPKIGYHVVLEHTRDGGDTNLLEYNISYDISDNLKVAGGVIKLPFNREELVSLAGQLTAERSIMNEFFTLNRSEGVLLTYSEDNWMVRGMFSDGANADVSEFDNDTSELALTVRGDIALEGDLKQAKDFTGWDGEGTSIVLGGAYHFELGDGRNGGDSDYNAWTVDVSYENEGLNLFAAYIGANIDPDESTASDRDMTGVVVQGGLDLVPDKFEVFARWEYIDGDVDGEDDFSAWTAGFNYYINGSRARFTTDVVYLNDDVPTANPFGASPTSNMLGVITGTEDEMAVRSQFQLLF